MSARGARLSAWAEETSGVDVAAEAEFERCAKRRSAAARRCNQNGTDSGLFESAAGGAAVIFRRFADWRMVRVATATFFSRPESHKSGGRSDLADLASSVSSGGGGISTTSSSLSNSMTMGDRRRLPR
jgi:hypothetical protein